MHDLLMLKMEGKLKSNACKMHTPQSIDNLQINVVLSRNYKYIYIYIHNYAKQLTLKSNDTHLKTLTKTKTKP